MKSNAEIISAAADLLEPEGAWIQGASARTKDGTLVKTTDASAACWCAFGALKVANGGNRRYDAEQLIVSGTDFKHIADWNDHPTRTQTEVVAYLRMVAEKCADA